MKRNSILLFRSGNIKIVFGFDWNFRTSHVFLFTFRCYSSLQFAMDPSGWIDGAGERVAKSFFFSKKINNFCICVVHSPTHRGNGAWNFPSEVAAQASQIVQIQSTSNYLKNELVTCTLWKQFAHPDDYPESKSIPCSNCHEITD